MQSTTALLKKNGSRSRANGHTAVQRPDPDSRSRTDEILALVAALNKAMVMVEFELDGTIITGNEIFEKASGYKLDEVKGKNFSMFMDPAFSASAAGEQFWRDLRNGQCLSGDFKRVIRGGKEIWVRAAISPVLDGDGKPFKIVELAADMTADKQRQANYENQIAALSNAVVMVEFELDGTIITGNENFEMASGYKLDEVKGKNFSMFLDPAFSASAAGEQFWRDLRNGKCLTGEVKRIARGGKEVWVQASTSPVLDGNGKPCKILEVDSDITAAKLQNADYQGQIAAISRNQPVIEYSLQGTVITANENFLTMMGYRLEEIKGQHHSIFVDPAHRATAEYKQFWRDLNDGKFYIGEAKRTAKDGKEIWIGVSYNPIFDLNGKPCKVVNTMTDITARKAMEANLQ